MGKGDNFGITSHLFYQWKFCPTMVISNKVRWHNRLYGSRHHFLQQWTEYFSLSGWIPQSIPKWECTTVHVPSTWTWQYFIRLVICTDCPATYWGGSYCNCCCWSCKPDRSTAGMLNSLVVCLLLPKSKEHFIIQHMPICNRICHLYGFRWPAYRVIDYTYNLQSSYFLPVFIHKQ